MIQQHRMQDEIDAGNIQERWLEEMAKRIVPNQPRAEVKVHQDGDTTLTSVWVRNMPVAFAVRTRDQWNYTVLTLIEVDPAMTDVWPPTPEPPPGETK